jgi:hypothetical protein
VPAVGGRLHPVIRREVIGKCQAQNVAFGVLRQKNTLPVRVTTDVNTPAFSHHAPSAWEHNANTIAPIDHQGAIERQPAMEKLAANVPVMLTFKFRQIQ